MIALAFFPAVVSGSATVSELQTKLHTGNKQEKIARVLRVRLDRSVTEASEIKRAELIKSIIKEELSHRLRGSDAQVSIPMPRTLEPLMKEQGYQKRLTDIESQLR